MNGMSLSLLGTSLKHPCWNADGIISTAFTPMVHTLNLLLLYSLPDCQPNVSLFTQLECKCTKVCNHAVQSRLDCAASLYTQSVLRAYFQSAGDTAMQQIITSLQFTIIWYWFSWYEWSRYVSLWILLPVSKKRNFHLFWDSGIQLGLKIVSVEMFVDQKRKYISSTYYSK